MLRWSTSLLAPLPPGLSDYNNIIPQTASSYLIEKDQRQTSCPDGGRKSFQGKAATPKRDFSSRPALQAMEGKEGGKALPGRGTCITIIIQITTSPFITS